MTTWWIYNLAGDVIEGVQAESAVDALLTRKDSAGFYAVPDGTFPSFE